MDVHKQTVQNVSESVRRFYDRKEPYRIYHGSTNSTRQSNRRQNQLVDISSLNRVLSIDTASKTAVVEPNVPMDHLVEETLRHNLLPPVAMEFPGITVGGGYAGTSGESSSFRYGFFDKTINWVEIVLANGDVVRASRTEHEDLFYGCASSFGTLGVTTLLEVQLIDAKPFVELTYHSITGANEAVEKIEQCTADSDIAYLDGIMFSRSSGVICAGRLVDHPIPGRALQKFTRPADPWFYLHAQDIIQQNPNTYTEIIPIKDYLFRYDRGGFWVGKYAFKYFITPFNFITRYILDYFMHTRVMYHALHRSGHYNQNVIQDVAVPYKSADVFIDYLDKDFGHYPLWLCPLKQSGESALGPSPKVPLPEGPDMLLNFGVWGPGPKKRQAFVEMNIRLERKVEELGGKKWLYAQAYYTEDEFWKIYDKTNYDDLRGKYHATHLPTIYDKVKVDDEADRKPANISWTEWLLAFLWSLWPISGLYGVLMVLVGGDYLLPKNSSKRMGHIKVA